MKASVPTSLAAAVDELDAKLSAEDRTFIAGETMEGFLGKTHHCGGMALRNEWSLWETKGVLNKDLQSRGYHHGDDKSGIILSLLWRRVHGKLWSDAFIAAQAESNRVHWEKQGVYPDGKPIPGAKQRTKERLLVKKDGTVEDIDS